MTAPLAAAAPGGARTGEAPPCERASCGALSDEARIATTGQAALKAKATEPPQVAPQPLLQALPTSALIEMVTRLSAGGLLSAGAAKALATGILRSPQLAAAIMGTVNGASCSGNLSAMVAELERLGCGTAAASAASSAPPLPPAPAAGSSRPRRTPVALTPFKSLPPDEDDESDNDGGHAAEEGKAGGGWLGTGTAARPAAAGLNPAAAPASSAASATSKALLLLIDALGTDGLLASPDVAALRAAVANDPSGALASAAVHAVVAFNSEGEAGGDVRVLLAALEHACDAHSTASAAPMLLSTPDAAQLQGHNSTTSEAHEGLAVGGSAGAAAATGSSPPLSLVDLQAVVSSLAGAGLVGAQDAAEASRAQRAACPPARLAHPCLVHTTALLQVRSELDAHDSAAIAALRSAIGAHDSLPATQ